MLRIPRRGFALGGLGAFTAAAEEAWLKARAPRPQPQVSASRCVEKGGHLITAGCAGNSCTYNCVTVTKGRGGYITTTEPVDGVWRQG